MSTFVVSGGAGFIGSNLTEALLRRGHVVRVLDDFSTGRKENLAGAESWCADGGGRLEIVEGDVRDFDRCRAVVDGADFVLHQAAVASVQRSIQDPLRTNEVNVNGTLNMLEVAREAEVERFVFASSSSIYGESETLPKIETMAPAPISPYALQKLAGETYCRLYYQLYGLRTVALRYFNVFGPRQDPTSEYSAVIPRFITAVKADEAPTIYGDGEQSRDFTFVANVVEVNRLACESGERAWGRAFNVGCGESITLNELVGEIGRIAGRSVSAEHTDPRPGDIRHSLAAIDAAAEALGFRPSVALAEGLARTFGAY